MSGFTEEQVLSFINRQGWFEVSKHGAQQIQLRRLLRQMEVDRKIKETSRNREMIVYGESK